MICRGVLTFSIFILSCLYSQAQVNFVESLASLGDETTTFGSSVSAIHGPGISFADFDNDGWDDITLPASENRSFQFLRNTGGQFEVLSLPIDDEGFRARQASWVDFDNDGDNDFFALGDTGKIWFYRNDGNNQFTDIRSSSGMASQSWKYWGFSWGDYNNDSFLDVLIFVRDPDQIQYNLLFRNEGDGTFTDVTIETGLTTQSRLTQAGAFFDYDRDGYQDIFFANDKEEIPNNLFRNNGDGTFSDVSIQSGMDLNMDGMSATIGDYNNDGWLDIYITNLYPSPNPSSIVGNAFMRNNKDGTFTNVAFQNGTRFDSFGWGAVFLDSEMDGDLDLYVSSHLDGSDGRIPAAYYDNDGSGLYEIPSDAGFSDDIRASYGNAIGDIENDGKPDIVVVNIDDQPLDIWHNQTTTTNNWLKVKLQGTQSNRMGIGSFIKVKAGDKAHFEYTLCGESYISQSSQTEFFGVGDETVIDYVQVTWLSGETDRIENVAVNQTITIVEGSFPAEPIIDEEEQPVVDEFADHSVARQWNEVLLDAIRVDFARPTVHARNLFHSSIAMYDAWAIFDEEAETVFLGKNFGGFACEFNGIETPEDIEAATNEVMSYALYRLLSHRFADSPGATFSLSNFASLFAVLGYDVNFTATNYGQGSYAALGNYLGVKLIEFGLQDGANEINGYENQYYIALNDPLTLSEYQEPLELNDPNHWQPLSFNNFVDQSGNPIPGGTPEFLSPEWGEVIPFAHKETDLEIKNNGDFDSYLYQDPGAPPAIENGGGIDDEYKWNFALVAAWSAHLDPNDPTLIDISPGALGNVDLSLFPQNLDEYKLFYDFVDGGDLGTGHALNPATNQPYTPQMVKRADYARVLAEFWADGPDSETPPGHWFTILNYVSDHPETIKRIEGTGEVLDDLEWDVKSYLALGGAMHDAAVSAWGVKGFYDYIRPISAIRYMASKGQSSNSSLPSYDPHGLPLITGLIELIEAGDPLAGAGNENVGKIKIYAWRGPDYITDPTLDTANVDWILGTRWWPYQRPDFVTPPFAGYVSGHSTFSRAAAEVLTLLTGDPFFPGGMGIFDIEQNNFLVFERGPSENLTLQWGTYRDASDQTSLSRIWGGIHPPVDDIPGRIMGDYIGKEAYALAKAYFDGLAILRYDNFLIEIASESCAGANDGSILIRAGDYYDYIADIANNQYEFKTNLTIGDLGSGTYQICLSIKGNSELQQCYELVVPEVDPFQLTAELNESGGESIMEVDIQSGTAPFFVEINDEIKAQYDSNKFDVSVKDGDKLKIFSSRLCEGSFSETVNIIPAVLLHPNPAASEALIQLKTTGKDVEVGIYTLGGQLIQVANYDQADSQIRLPLDQIADGIYLVRIRQSGIEQVFKLVKN